jgi:hypothetical protein
LVRSAVARECKKLVDSCSDMTRERYGGKDFIAKLPSCVISTLCNNEGIVKYTKHSEKNVVILHIIMAAQDKELIMQFNIFPTQNFRAYISFASWFYMT